MNVYLMIRYLELCLNISIEMFSDYFLYYIKPYKDIKYWIASH